MEKGSAHANRVECIGVEHRLYRAKVARRMSVFTCWLFRVYVLLPVCPVRVGQSLLYDPLTMPHCPSSTTTVSLAGSSMRSVNMIGRTVWLVIDAALRPSDHTSHSGRNSDM